MTENKTKYNVIKTLKKVVKYLILVGLPFLATNYPAVLDLTIGGVLVIAYDYLKHGKFNVRLP
jgi:hypothetical protein